MLLNLLKLNVQNIEFSNGKLIGNNKLYNKYNTCIFLYNDLIINCVFNLIIDQIVHKIYRYC